MKNKKWRNALSVVCLLLAVGVSMIDIKYNTNILILIALLYCIIIGILLFAEKDVKIESKKENDIILPIQLPLPYAIIDKQKKLLSYNTLFEEMIKGNQKSFRKLFPEYDIQKAKQLIHFKNKTFDVYTSCESDNRILCFAETTEYQNLEEIVKEQKTVVALLFLDNYEEVIESLEEIRLPILTAVIDGKLNAFASSMGGIIRKFEKDRYILLFSQKQLEGLKEKKFDILTQIREISVGEHIPVTISMGIGIEDKNLEAAMKNAKAAVALALGRGGDQVLIKEGEKYLFYGGKSGEMSHNTRIRARVKEIGRAHV